MNRECAFITGWFTDQYAAGALPPVHAGTAAMMKIDHNVPIPPSPNRGNTRYPWRQMEIGDSFFVEERGLPSMRANAVATGKLLGRKFLVRKDGDGVRVWRTQ